MSATLRQVREALQTRLGQITGASYHISLAGTDCVKVGRYPDAWKPPPCCELFLVKDSPTPGPTLVGRERTAQFGVVVWAAATAMDPEVREDLIEDVMEDLMLRFRASADRSLGGLAIDVTPALEEAIGAEPAKTPMPVMVIASLSVRYREAS